MPKKKFEEFKQGIFHPMNPKKCLNKSHEPPVYRSSLERSVMMTLDKNDNILEWSSEKIFIPYYKKTEKRMARYFVDFWWRIKIKDVIFEYIVEVKPHRQTIPPTVSNKKKSSTILYEQVEWQNNQDKWEAALAWCKMKKDKHNRNVYFQIITEKNIDVILGK